MADIIIEDKDSYDRLYKMRDPDKWKQYYQTYYQKNKAKYTKPRTKAREYARAYRHANAERCRDYFQKYYQKNKSSIKDTSKKWQVNNKAYYLMYMRQYRLKCAPITQMTKMPVEIRFD